MCRHVCEATRSAATDSPCLGCGSTTRTLNYAPGGGLCQTHCQHKIDSPIGGRVVLIGKGA